MKNFIRMVFFFIILQLFVFIQYSGNKESATNKKNYLGQILPGNIPVVFAPDIVSNPGTIEYAGSLSPDGKTFFFTRRERKRSDQRIWFSEIKNNQWSRPKKAEFSKDHMSYEPVFSPDGKTLYYGSQKPFPGKPKSEKFTYFWFKKKSDTGWSKSQLMPEIIRNELPSYITIAANGSIYFGSYKHRGILVSEMRDNKQIKPRQIAAEIDQFPGAGHPYISPDESFIIFDSNQGKVNFGTFDLFISFRKRDGSWTYPVNLGNSINSPAAELCGSVSPDGKFLFFNRWSANNESDIYWLSSDIIKKMKSKFVNN